MVAISGHWRLAGALTALLLAGCGIGQPDRDPLEGHRLQWTKLADGSQFATTTSEERSVGGRCWPNRAGGFRCLVASIYRAGGVELTAVLGRDTAELPTLDLELYTTADGYHCQYLLNYQEVIERGSKMLVSNQPGYATAPWTRGYVERFMRDNAVKGDRYFRCLDVLQKVNAGSMETLGTTVVSRAMVG